MKSLNTGKSSSALKMTDRRGTILLFALIFVFPFLFSFSDKPAYIIYQKNGKEISYAKFLSVLQGADVVLFGELHNDPVSHWLELSVLKDLPREKLITGAEMFESDDQEALSGFIKGQLSQEEFEKGTDLWSNFATDYLPLLKYASEQQIPFIATSVPRKYARQVARKGIVSLDSLFPEDKKWIAPLPVTIDFNLPGYQNMMKEGIHGHSIGNNRYMAEAQALKDATMAHFIFSHWEQGKTFVHFNGAYHSDNFEGIYWYLKQKKKELKIVTITTVEQARINKLDNNHLHKADLIIAVPEDMTKTY